MKNILVLLIAVSLAVPAMANRISATEKLPLEAFSMMPVIRDVQVSPNGAKILIIRTLTKDGFYVIEIRDAKNLAKKPITLGSETLKITQATWVNNKKIMVNFRKQEKRGGRKVFVSQTAIVNADGTGRWEQMLKTGSPGLLSILPKDPDHILLNYDMDGNRFPDVVKFNVNNKRKSGVFMGSDATSSGIILDNDGEVRGAIEYNFGADTQTFKVRVKGNTDWKKLKVISPDSRETFQLAGIDGDNPNIMYTIENRGHNTAGIYAVNLETLEYSERMFGTKSYDARGIIASGKLETLGSLQGFTYYAGDFKRYYIDEGEAAFRKSIEALFPKRTVTLDRSQDDNTIIIRTTGAKDPGTFYMLKDKKDLQYIGGTYPLQTEDKLGPVKFISYKARDGRKVRAYVTMPLGDGPHPTIVMPHGGPWVRDEGRYDPWAALLANEGFMVVRPQYRGTPGFGLDHWLAGDAQWGLTMQDDVDDAALEMVRRGWADKDRLAIYGWSFGGYSALVAATRENNIYKCSFAGASVADLDQWLAVIYRQRFLRIFQRPTVRGVNPVDVAKNVNIPLMVLHGEDDRQVNTKHSRDFVAKLKKHNVPHTYLEVPGMRHGGFDFEQKEILYKELINWFNNECFK
ncbi:prolyl oligopeptidase family serine peptidase [Temperatibacter marinus]|uniref:Prolyl oligopeptidase family serine peptidase n=1 Tax=Temperatibacter marinus TaxID=1456591 RepID=A0AA52H8F3_9PROT|nr:prolyl oligopeptidase family serine peptidase [Temperatibacter marinus]WND01387.1 prolyl oligopeptidase family serine peptidase [Temperatibacter marinus]